MTKDENSIKEDKMKCKINSTDKKEKGYDTEPWIKFKKPMTQQKLINKINKRRAYLKRVKDKDRKICNKCGKEFLTYNLNYCRDCVSIDNRRNRLKKKQSWKVENSLLYIIYEPLISQVMKIGETTDMYVRYAGYKCKSETSTGDKFIRYLIENNRCIEEFVLFVFDLSVIDSGDNKTQIRKHIEYYLQTQIPCVVDTKRKPKNYNEDKAKEYLSNLMENSKSYEIKLGTNKSNEDNIENSYLYKFWNGSNLENFKIRMEI